MKERTRITIDISPELRQRIKIAALHKNLSISEYLSNILEQSVPDEITVAEQVLRESKGHIFEDSTEAIRRMREERTRELDEL